MPNLTVATHLSGTPWLPSHDGALLVLEDVGKAHVLGGSDVDPMAFKRTAEQTVCDRLWSLHWDEEDILPDNFSMEEIFQERLGDLGIAEVLDLPGDMCCPIRHCPSGQWPGSTDERAPLNS